MPIRTLTLMFFSLLMVKGCIRVPDVVTLSLNPSRLKLEPSVVIDEKGASADILMIDITGLIAETVPAATFGVTQNPLDDLVRRLEAAEKNPRVKAVVIRINSPGGGVGASEIMFNEIRRFRERSEKPVVATMGEIAASGGYYVAMAADEILAPEASITGSIGVIIPTLNVSDGMARIGLRSRAVTSGPNKDIANPLEPVDEEHYSILQSLVDEFYQQFIKKVRDRRPEMTSEDLATYTDGRIVTGAEAKRVGLVDEIGGIREAHDAAKKLAGIDRARLVKLAPAGVAPSTPYARALSSSQTPTRPAGTGLHAVFEFLQSERQRTLPVGVYYLWMPPAP